MGAVTSPNINTARPGTLDSKGPLNMVYQLLFSKLLNKTVKDITGRYVDYHVQLMLL